MLYEGRDAPVKLSFLSGNLRLIFKGGGTQSECSHEDYGDKESVLLNPPSF